jgi:hypothetical protein
MDHNIYSRVRGPHIVWGQGLSQYLPGAPRASTLGLRALTVSALGLGALTASAAGSGALRVSAAGSGAFTLSAGGSGALKATSAGSGALKATSAGSGALPECDLQKTGSHYFFPNQGQSQCLL